MSEDLDHIDYLMGYLGMSLNFADPDGSLSSKGYRSDGEKQVWEAVLEDYRKLSEAIHGLREESQKRELELEQVKTELLAWAGLHRGKAIHEDAMPRFHEIIDKIGTLMKEGN